nr:hypothetical protein [Lentzea guizhouensis]
MRLDGRGDLAPHGAGHRTTARVAAGEALQLVPGDEALHVGVGGGRVVEPHGVAGQVVGGERDLVDGAGGHVVEHRVEQGFLVAEVGVDESGAALRALGDPVDARSGEAAPGELGQRGVEQLALLGFGIPDSAAWCT